MGLSVIAEVITSFDKVDSFTVRLIMLCTKRNKSRKVKLLSLAFTLSLN